MLASSPVSASPKMTRNVWVLAIAQALHVTNSAMVVTISGLVGARLTATPSLATVPVTAVLLGGLCMAMPASLLMHRFGRRAGFRLGAACVIAGAGSAAWAIMAASFWGFVGASFVLGLNNGVAAFYRFAAVDDAEPAFRPKAISWVLSGGIVAAFVGPTLGRTTVDLVDNAPFAGSFVTATAVGCMLLLTLGYVTGGRPIIREAHGGRPIAEIVRQPAFYVAVLTGAVGYAVMSLIMTATPLAMADHGMGVHDSATVISWHVFAMYAPALVAGSIVARYGVPNVLLSGLALLTVCCGIALAGVDFHHFFIALLLLGLGWCLCFVAASALLTESYAPNERAKVQGLNDFLVMGSVAAASALSGGLLHWAGWTAVQLAALPFLALATAAVVGLVLARRRTAR